MLTAIDLFAGLGGTTEGARLAGVRTLWAANHLQGAVDIHALNHPHATHACQDLQRADFTVVPDHDILMGSPCCIPLTQDVIRPTGELAKAGDIRLGDALLTHLGRGRRVVNIWKKKYSGWMYRFVAWGHTMQETSMTGDHRVWVRRKKHEPAFLKAHQVRPGDYVAFPRLKSVGGTALTFVNSKLPERIEYRVGVRTDSNRQSMVKIDGSSRNLWWLIGHYLGDGQSRQDRYDLGWSTGDSRENFDRVMSILRGMGLSPWGWGEEGNRAVFVSSRHLYEICTSFGTKAHNKYVPSELLHLEDEYVEEMLDGYFAADGSDRDRGCPTHRNTSVSLPLLQGLQQLAWRMGWSSGICIGDYEREAAIEGRVVQCRDSWELWVKKKPHAQSRTKSTDTHVWRSVKSIERTLVTRLDVVDFEVEEDHTFCLPGLVVHNCQGHSDAKGKTKHWSENSRSTAWCIFSAMSKKRPKAAMIENVPEFRRWTESDDPMDAGNVFRHWQTLIRKIGPGYHYSEIVLDSADLGVPINRKRLFMVFARKDVCGPVEIPMPSLPHRPFAAVVEHRIGTTWSKVADRADSVRGFVARSSPRYRRDRFLIPYFGKTLERGYGRSLGRPLGSITTKARYGMVDETHKWMRMLSVAEYRAAMGFGAHYVLPEGVTESIGLLGNAVVPEAAAYVLKHIVGAIAPGKGN